MKAITAFLGGKTRTFWTYSDGLKKTKEELLYGVDIGNLIDHWRISGNIEGVEYWSDFILRIAVGLNFALAISPNEKTILIVVYKPISLAKHLSPHPQISFVVTMYYFIYV